MKNNLWKLVLATVFSLTAVSAFASEGKEKANSTKEETLSNTPEAPLPNPTPTPSGGCGCGKPKTN